MSSREHPFAAICHQLIVPWATFAKGKKPEVHEQLPDGSWEIVWGHEPWFIANQPCCQITQGFLSTVQSQPPGPLPTAFPRDLFLTARRRYEGGGDTARRAGREGRGPSATVRTHFLRSEGRLWPTSSIKALYKEQLSLAPPGLSMGGSQELQCY